tara:strand:- start:480 stop:1208 length:729 start_codon:yes stop_codon:yes gene_type:complete
MINLDRAVPRKDAMEARLADIGLKYIRFSAVDGAAEWETLASSVDIAAFRRNTGRDVMNGEIGCYHSHLRVWQMLVQSDAPMALVLEDDVVFHDGFLGALKLAIAQADNWDFLKFNKIRAKHPKFQFSAEGYNFNAYRGPSTEFGCYLIKRELATRLIPAMMPITRPIDIEADRIHVHHYRHLGIEPFPSHVDDGNVSTITGANYSNVRKYPWYRRLPAYALRWQNLWAKSAYLRAGKSRKN